MRILVHVLTLLIVKLLLTLETYKCLQNI